MTIAALNRSKSAEMITCSSEFELSVFAATPLYSRFAKLKFGLLAKLTSSGLKTIVIQINVYESAPVL